MIDPLDQLIGRLIGRPIVDVGSPAPGASPTSRTPGIDRGAEARFFDQMWGQRVALGHGPVDDWLAWFPLEHWTARRHLGAIDAATRDASGRQTQRRIAIEEIDEALAAGQTICADVSAAPELAPRLRALHASTTPSAEAAFAKLYVSPAGAGFAPHMDTHHVFVLQLAGRKQWHVTEPLVPATLVGGKLDARGRPVHTGVLDGEPIELDDGSALETLGPMRTLELAPGDCLYVPPGAWHSTNALEPSIALSVSPPRAPGLRLVLGVLEQELARRPIWRDDLRRGHAERQGISEALGARLSRLRRELRDVIDELDDATLVRAWALGGLTLAPGNGPDTADPVRPDDLLEHTDPRGFVFVEAAADDGDGNALFVYRPGGEWVLPTDARQFLEHLVEVPRFRAKAALDWDRRLDWSGAAEVLSQLVAAGFLRRAR